MKSRAFLAFVAVFCVGGLVYGPVVSLLRVSAGFYWTTIFLVALLGAAAAASGRAAHVRGEFLCDRCRYNDARYCDRPERPNATSCTDYRDR